MPCKGIVVVSLCELVSKGVQTPSRSESDKKPHGLKVMWNPNNLIVKCLTYFQCSKT